MYSRKTTDPEILRQHRKMLLLCCASVLFFLSCVLIFCCHRNAEGNIHDHIAGLIGDSAMRAESFMGNVSQILTQSCDDILFINVGLSNEPDTWQNIQLASSRLGRICSMHSSIESAYLFCNKPGYVLTSQSLAEIPFDSFYDNTWINRYYSSKQGIQLLDTPRIVITPSKIQEHCISLVSRVSFFSTLHNKWLVFNIDTQQLSNCLPAEDSSSGFPATSFALYNSEGELICSTGSADIPAQSPFMFSDGSPESFQNVQCGSAACHCLFSEETKQGWHIVSFTPVQSINSAVLKAILPAALGIFFFYVLLIAAVLLLRRRTERVLNNLCSEISGASGIKMDKTAQPLDWMRDTALHLYNKSQENEKMLGEYFPVIRNKLISELLHGYPVSEDASLTKKVLIKTGLDLRPGTKYFALAVYCDAISDIKANLSRAAYNQFLSAMECECNEELPQDVKAFYVRIKSSYLAAILCLPADKAELLHEESFEAFGERIQQHLTLLSKQPVYVALGDLQDDIQKVSESFNHAMQLAQNKLHHHQETPFTYSRMLTLSFEMNYDDRTQLINLLKLGKKDKVLDMLEHYFSTLGNAPEAGLEGIQKLCSDLITQFTEVIRPYYDTDTENMPKCPQPDPIGEVSDIRTLAEPVMSYAAHCADIVSEHLTDRKDDRMLDTLHWINDNYSRDISLDDIAARMELSPTYASKQFKAYTGVNLVTYINDLRIKRAMELLATTDLNTGEISSHVGFHNPQSFNRTFSKQTGMTPGNYRTLHKTDK